MLELNEMILIKALMKCLSISLIQQITFQFHDIS
jgi:hypothetical protein